MTDPSLLNIVQIYTDGACKGNGQVNNVGGFGAVLLHGDSTLEVKGGKRDTTNNEMELAAIWAALSKITNTDYHFIIYTDSSYCMDAFEKWVEGWRKNGWRNKDKRPIKNQKIIELVYNQLKSLKSYEFVKVKGHSGVKWNERADKLANEGVLIASNEKTVTATEKDSYGLIAGRKYSGVLGCRMVKFLYNKPDDFIVLSSVDLSTKIELTDEQLVQMNQEKISLHQLVNPDTLMLIN